MAKITKEMVLKELPKGYKAYVSKHGLTVLVSCKLNDFNSINDAEKTVDKMAKKLKLDFVGSGTDLASNVRDWEFTSLDAEHEMIAEAKDVLKTMKAFQMEKY